MNKILEKILDCFFPKGVACINCGAELPRTEKTYSLCPDCKKKLYIASEDERRAADGRTPVYGAYWYDDTARSLVLGYKDDGKPYIAEYMAAEMYGKMKEKHIECDCIVFVPSNKETIKRRGYDAMKLVAEALSRMSGLPIAVPIKKRENTADLASLPKEERAAAVKGSFYTCGESLTEGKRVLLIDDVTTSGATIGECLRLIYGDGALDAVVLTFCLAKSTH